MKIILDNIKDNFNKEHRKTDMPGLCRVYKVFDRNFNEIIDCKLYYSTSFSTCYCCLWIKYKNRQYACSGKSCGEGYDRQSAAVRSAIDNAGIIFTPSFWGAGASETRYALKELARKVSGKRLVYLIDSHA